MKSEAPGFTVFPFRLECSFPRGAASPELADVSILSRQFPDWLRRVCCSTPSLDCRSCESAGRCGYALLFSPPLSDEVNGIPFIEDAAMPFAIRPRIGRRDNPGFDVTLVGSAAQAVGQVVEAFVQMGLSGYGRERTVFKVISLVALDGHGNGKGATVEAGSVSRLRKVSALGIREMVGDVAFSQFKECSIRFETLPLLKPGNAWSAPQPGLLIRRLRDRIKVLGLSYCGGEPDLKLKGLAAEAEHVRAEYSRVEHGSVSLKLSGPLRDFIPILKIGSFLNVGRGCAFGQGWYGVL
jgi:hypothetical protein